jgi:hypothetical protein
MQHLNGVVRFSTTKGSVLILLTTQVFSKNSIYGPCLTLARVISFMLQYKQPLGKW